MEFLGAWQMGHLISHSEVEEAFDTRSSSAPCIPLIMNSHSLPILFLSNSTLSPLGGANESSTRKNHSSSVFFFHFLFFILFRKVKKLILFIRNAAR